MEDLARQMRDQARRYGEKMRDQARRRKAEYLGARVPADLKRKVIAHAERRGIPVSDLIRDTLEKAFGDLPDAVRETEKPAGSYPDVIGWELIELNRRMRCTGCGTELAVGERASLGLALGRGDHAILCRKCRPQTPTI